MVLERRYVKGKLVSLQFGSGDAVCLGWDRLPLCVGGVDGGVQFYGGRNQ